MWLHFVLRQNIHILPTKWIFLTGIVLFEAGSAICGAAQTQSLLSLVGPLLDLVQRHLHWSYHYHVEHRPPPPKAHSGRAYLALASE